jgi:S1-C subfamily serine protease
VRAAVLALALFLGACGFSARTEVVEAPERADVAVVAALKHTVYWKQAGCTAVDLGGGRVVTAKHCVEDEDPALNFPVGTKTDIGTVVFKSADRDFAVLINQDWVKHAAPAMRNPRLGEHLYAVGYPLQLSTKTQELTVTDGVAAGPLSDEGTLRITAPIYFGNSGGGAWAEDGSFLGVTVSGFLELPGMNYMVGAEDVVAAL